MVPYRETVRFGAVYHTLMLGTLAVLAAALTVFLATKVYVGAIAVAAVLPFQLWVCLGCRKFDLLVTDEEFVARHWFLRLRLRLSDIASVQVRDRLELPEPYRGHIKVGPGYHGWKDLKVLVCRGGASVVEIRRKDGLLFIIAPTDATALYEAVRSGSQEAAATEGEAR